MKNIDKILKYIFGICVVLFMYVIALNGRYDKVGNGNVILDKWKKETFVIGTKECPIIMNGTEKTNQ